MRPLYHFAGLLALPTFLSMGVPVHADGSVPFVEGQIIVSLRSESAVGGVLERWGASILEQEGESLFLLSASSSDVPGLVLAMSQDADVASVEPNYRMQSPEAVRHMILAVVGGTSEEYEDQSATERIGLSDAHLVSRGSGVTVAILDTGFDAEHPALVGHLSSARFDFVDHDSDPSEVADGIDQDGDGALDEGFGHGTMVAGLVSLIAPEAVLLPVRVLDSEGRGDAFTIVRGLRYAVQQGADVINISFGAPQVVQILRDEIEAAADAGITLIGAAGNEDRPGPTYSPADLSGVTMVTAVDDEDVKAEFADYHNKVVVCAPGVGLRSTYPGGGWALGSGCSFSTALVSGSAALVRAAFPAIAKSDIDHRLETGTVSIDEVAGNHAYAARLGSGRIDLLRMLDSSAGIGSISPEGVGFSIRPNPMRDRAHFILDGMNEGLTLRVVDAAGRLVLERTVSETGSFEWDGRDARGELLPAGSYGVQLGNARARVTLVR